MMKALILCVLCGILPLQAQFILPSKEVSLIAVIDKEYHFYHQKKNGSYVAMLLNFRRESLPDSTFYAYTPYWKMDDKELSYNDLHLRKDAFIEMKDVRPTILDEMIGKNFGNPTVMLKKQKTHCFSLLNTSVASERKLEFETKAYRGERLFIEDEEGWSHIVKDTLPRWESYEFQYYAYFVLDVGKGRYFFLLSDLKGGDNTPYISKIYFPPKEKKTIAALDRYSWQENISKMEELPPIEMRYTKWINYWNVNEFLTLRPQGKQYELVNRFNHKVLPKSYDTIYYNEYGVIGKNKNSLEFYNYQHQPIKFKGVKVAYLYNIGIEALTEKGVELYDMNGQKVAKLPKAYRGYCGPSFREEVYHLNKDTIEKNITHYIDFKDTPLMSGSEVADERYRLIDRNAEEEVAFINARNYYERSYLSWDNKEEERTRLFPHLLSVKREGKVGLFYYDYSKATNYTNEEIQNLYNNFFLKDKDGSSVFILGMIPTVIKYMKGKQLLPFVFDKIEQKENDVIYLYKDGKIGFYPQISTQYDKAIPLSTSFYAIEKNGKKGFLDIHTLQEYF